MSSYNAVYDWKVFSDAVPVIHVGDGSLARLKNNHSSDHVRLSAAGFEATKALADNIEKVRFFYNTKTWDASLVLLLHVSNIGYMHSCASSDSVKLTRQMEEDEGKSIAKRDFTGLDCNAWAYDLHRSDERYEARGIHPSGVGFRRYRTTDNMTEAERDYLLMHARLSLINLIDPQMFGINRLVLTRREGKPVSFFNFALRHIPTSFGTDTRADFLLDSPTLKLSPSIHNYVNHSHYFPGLELEVLRQPVLEEGRSRLLLSSRLGLWLQPERQSFFTSQAALGAVAAARATWQISSFFGSYAKVEAKTSGWVSGIAYLEPSLTMRTGLSARVF